MKIIDHAMQAGKMGTAKPRTELRISVCSELHARHASRYSLYCLRTLRPHFPLWDFSAMSRRKIPGRDASPLGKLEKSPRRRESMIVVLNLPEGTNTETPYRSSYHKIAEPASTAL